MDGFESFYDIFLTKKKFRDKLTPCEEDTTMTEQKRHYIPTPEKRAEMGKFQADYIARMTKLKRQEKGGAELTSREYLDIRIDAETHIHNIFPKWNEWDDQKRVQELQSLPASQLAGALSSVVDGGVPVIFYLPDKDKVALSEQLMKANLQREVKEILAMVNKYDETIFDVMEQGSPFRTQLGKIQTEANVIDHRRRIGYKILEKNKRVKLKGLSARLKKTEPKEEEEKEVLPQLKKTRERD